MVLTGRHIDWVNRILMGVQAVLVCATVTAGIGLIRRPLQDSTAPEGSPGVASRPADALVSRPLDWYSPIWNRDLRQPPIEPAPVNQIAPATDPPPAPPPTLKIRLLGTVVEAQERFGVFADEKGGLAVRRRSETVDGHTILAIERGKAQIKSGTRVVWLKMPEYDHRFGGKGGP